MTVQPAIITPAMIEQVKAYQRRAEQETDPMLKRSKDMAAMVPYWDLTDDLIAGAAAVKLNPEYLPRFPQEDDNTYSLRACLTKYTNIYGDIVESLASKPFEEEIQLVEEKDKSIPDQIDEFIEDVDGAGNNLTVYAGDVFYNGINSAINWIFVDYPTVDPTVVRTRADLKAAKIRPFWSHVLGRNVLEVKTKLIGGDETIVYIRIYEPGEKDHVRIFERSDTNVVTWELYVETDTVDEKTKTRFVLEDSGILSIDEIPLVPFITGRRSGRTFKIAPPMRAAADLQLELFQQESGLKYIKTIAAYPMLAANGISPQLNPDGSAKPLAIGPMRVLYGKPDAAGNHGEWKYVEPAATSMKFLADDIKETTQNLRELGRQPLTAQSGNLTVITTAVAAGKAKSAVGAWALLLKDALENALVITAKWMKLADYDPQVNVYTEFDNYADDSKDKDTLLGMRKNGDLSQETLWYEMKRRGVLSPEFEADDEREKILEEVPGDGETDDLSEDDNPSNTNDPALAG